MKPALLITTDNFLPRWDGIARFLSEVIPRLKKYYTITVACPRFPGKLQKPEGITIVRYPLHKNLKFGDITFAWFPKKSLRKLVANADVMFNQSLGPIGYTAINEAKRQKKPVFSYVHSIEWELASKSVKRFREFVKSFARSIVVRSYNKCTGLLVPNRELAGLLSQVGIKTKKYVVQLGVDVKKFKPASDKRASKRKLGLNPDSRIIGYCGRIGREKDIPTLYKAFAQLKKRHKDLKLLIVGTGLEEGPWHKDKRVIHAGSQDNVMPWLQAMDVYVLPSLTETSSLSTMEAMAVGLPVVVTPVGSIKEYVKPGRNGLLFSRGNWKELAEDLEVLLHSPAMRATLGKAARKTMLEQYTWDHVVRNIRRVLVNQ